MSTLDVLFLGSSPSALAGAARLARKGLRVLVLDTRDQVGGPVATEPFAPGFRADVGVASAALDPEVARELSVSVDVIRRDSVTALGASPVTLRSLPELPVAVHDAVALLQALYRGAPPELPAPTPDGAAVLSDLGARLLGLGPRRMHEVLRLLTLPVRDFVEELGVSEAVGAVLAGAAVRAVSEGPFATGTLFGLLHHLALDDGPLRSSARGGVGALAGALADAARRFGAEIRTGVPGPLHVEVEGGAARGVRLGNGERITASAVVSDHDVRTTLTQLVSPSELDPEVNRAVRTVRYRGSVARVHLALSALPRFEGVDPDALRGTLVVAPSVAAIERAWDQAKRGTVPDHPYIEATLPTVADPSLAPEGKHVLDAWIQYVPRGRSTPDALVKALLDGLAPFAPGLRGLVLHHAVSRPEDLEARFGLSEGHLYGGEVRLSQTFFLRAAPFSARYESPVENLYLAGSSAHPGGYSGRSGWNLAEEIAGPGLGQTGPA